MVRALAFTNMFHKPNVLGMTQLWEQQLWSTIINSISPSQGSIGHHFNITLITINNTTKITNYLPSNLNIYVWKIHVSNNTYLVIKIGW
jgi:hypothetical protein